ncbi:MAG: arsenate reductase ArsC [Ignavibacteria bacterium]|nr:arsenate reductase ArsC [Ignavibacteria bacterium]
MEKIKVLFVCEHNSARSQMAEAFLNTLAGEKFCAESAGLTPGTLNPLVVRALKESGIEISGKQTNDVFEFFKQGRMFSYVITVCDAAAGEKCPLFPGIAIKIHKSFDDPSKFTGTDEEKMVKVRKVRDEIKEYIEQFIKETEMQL